MTYQAVRLVPAGLARRELVFSSMTQLLAPVLWISILLLPLSVFLSAQMSSEHIVFHNVIFLL